MDEVTELGLVEPFDIDDGSLSTMTQEQAFTLGVEWQMVRATMAQNREYQVHLANARRLQAMLSRNGFGSHLTLIDDDWAVICTEEHPQEITP